MKKKIIIILLLFSIINLFYAETNSASPSEEMKILLKENIGNVVNVWILGTYAGYFRGKIISVTNEFLIITADKNEQVSNPYGKDLTGKSYIRLDSIMAIRIADKDNK